MFQSSTILVAAIAATLYLMPLGTSSVVCATRQQAANVDLRDGGEGLNRMLMAARDFGSQTIDGPSSIGKRAFAKKRNEQVGDIQATDEQDISTTQQQQQQIALSKQRLALKKKWHRLVDELIDGELPSEMTDTMKQREQQQQPEFGGSSSYRHKKWSATTGVDDEGDKIMILMKKPPLYASDLQDSDLDSNQALSSIGNGNNNNNNKELKLLKAITGNTDTDQAWPSKTSLNQRSNQAQGELRSPLEGNHGRDLLNDKFGILRDSIFTTNNHLGFKGVPKFGSDEVY